MVAVITADLVSSTRYSEELQEKVLEVLKKEFADLEREAKNQTKFNLFRGDSFQGIVYEPRQALFSAFRLKCAVNRIFLEKKGKTPEADLRMAIGIGTLDYEGASIEESNGEAFRFSGRTLDEMKEESRKLRLKTPNEEINEEFETSFFLLDFLTDRWSTASAEVIYYLLKGWREKEIATSLKISQSAVNQRKKAAGWEAIKRLLERYENVISKEFPYE